MSGLVPRRERVIPRPPVRTQSCNCRAEWWGEGGQPGECNSVCPRRMHHWYALICELHVLTGLRNIVVVWQVLKGLLMSAAGEEGGRVGGNGWCVLCHKLVYPLIPSHNNCTPTHLPTNSTISSSYANVHRQQCSTLATQLLHPTRTYLPTYQHLASACLYSPTPIPQHQCNPSSSHQIYFC